MIIQGAVLEQTGLTRPYADSKPITLSALELDPPGAGEILIRIESAGLCHSDLSVVDGSRPRPTPILLGHEASGIIEQSGAGVIGLVEGQRVVATFLPRCGECRSCLTGGLVPCSFGSAANAAGSLMSGSIRLHRDGKPVFHHLGVSGFATYAVADQRSVVSVEDDVPADIAALFGCAVLTGGGAVINAGLLKAGQRVIVVGLGGVGMAAILTALAHTSTEVIGVDTLPHKLTTARTLGAHSVYTPEEALGQGLTADLVVEAAGSAAGFETAVKLTSIGGKTVTVGLPSPSARASISPLQLVTNAQIIIGSYLGSAVPKRDIQIFVDLWRSGKLPVEKLITSRLTLSDINKGLDDLAAGNSIRQIVTFD